MTRQMQRQYHKELSRQSKSIARIEEHVIRPTMQSLCENEVVTNNADAQAHLEKVIAEVGKARSIFPGSFVQAEFELRLRDVVSDSLNGLTVANAGSTDNISDTCWLSQPNRISKVTVTRTHSRACCFFGTINCTSEMRLHSRDQFSDKKEGQRFDSKTTIQLVPAQWMMRWGLRCIYLLRIAHSSQVGWQSSLRTFNVTSESTASHNSTNRLLACSRQLLGI